LIDREKLFGRIRRLFRYRLVIPILRAKHPPEYTARGVLVGLLIAMTPTVGVQMVIVFAIWLMIRAVFPTLSFNLVIGMAWTWITNVVTAPPLYYVFLVTGRVMLGQWEPVTGYQAFRSRIVALMTIDANWFEAFWRFLVGIFSEWGVPMFLGSVPWALLTAWLGYRWSVRLIRRFRLRRMRRLMSLHRRA
jgi:uncharacterized protein (DUF2062 family)